MAAVAVGRRPRRRPAGLGLLDPAGTAVLVGAAAFAREAALVAGLYSCGSSPARSRSCRSTAPSTGAAPSGTSSRRSTCRASWPSRQPPCPHPWLIQAANLYYAIAHAPGARIFLVWLFLRHRDQYPLWRNVIAILTGACLPSSCAGRTAPAAPRPRLRRHRPPLRPVRLRRRVGDGRLRPALGHAVGARRLGGRRRRSPSCWSAPAGGAGSCWPTRSSRPTSSWSPPTTGGSTASWPSASCCRRPGAACAAAPARTVARRSSASATGRCARGRAERGRRPCPDATGRRGRLPCRAMDVRLDGKVALVTGASRGIGKAIAAAVRGLGREGDAHARASRRRSTRRPPTMTARPR